MEGGGYSGAAKARKAGLRSRHAGERPSLTRRADSLSARDSRKRPQTHRWASPREEVVMFRKAVIPRPSLGLRCDSGPRKCLTASSVGVVSQPWSCGHTNIPGRWHRHNSESSHGTITALGGFTARSRAHVILAALFHTSNSFMGAASRGDPARSRFGRSGRTAPDDHREKSLWKAFGRCPRVSPEVLYTPRRRRIKQIITESLRPGRCRSGRWWPDLLELP